MENDGNKLAGSGVVACMELTTKVKVLPKEGAMQLRGSARRLFMARAVDAMGPEAQRLAQRELGWDRETIRKGLHELRTGVECVDGRCANDAKSADELWPNLRADIKEIVDSQSQTDPRFHTTRLYRRLSVPQVVVQLKEQKGYTNLDLQASLVHSGNSSRPDAAGSSAGTVCNGRRIRPRHPQRQRSCFAAPAWIASSVLRCCSGPVGTTSC
jgi:hypothetical protein